MQSPVELLLQQLMPGLANAGLLNIPSSATAPMAPSGLPFDLSKMLQQLRGGGLPTQSVGDMDPYAAAEAHNASNPAGAGGPSMTPGSFAPTSDQAGQFVNPKIIADAPMPQPRPDEFGRGAGPVPYAEIAGSRIFAGAPMQYGMLGVGGSGLPLPPPTNDPQSGEPQPVDPPRERITVTPAAAKAPNTAPEPDNTRYQRAAAAAGITGEDPAMGRAVVADNAAGVFRSPKDAIELSAKARTGVVDPAAALKEQTGSPLQNLVSGIPLIGGALKDSVLFNPDYKATLLAMAGGFAGSRTIGEGMSRGFTNAAQVMPTDRANAVKKSGLAETYNALLKHGVPKEEAVAALYNDTLMKALVAKYFGEGKYHTVDGALVHIPASGGKPEVVYDATKKPPAGWQKNAEGTGWEPVPGGPHDPKTIKTEAEAKAGPIKLPAEQAGRLALMHEAAKDFPEATKVLMKDRGPYGIDKTVTAASYGLELGEVGRARRTMRTAIEGALRAMTGAAAPESEVKRYESMFMPSVFDSPETAQQKIDQLKGFIDRATAIATQGQQDKVPGLNPTTAPAGNDGFKIKRLN